MELLYTYLFIIFIYKWFSKYNFITFILLLFLLNTIRNVRLYMFQNNITNSTNPFLNGIKYLFNGVNWITSKISNSNSYLSEKIPLIGYFNNKYVELNNYFLEVFRISKKQMINQFANKFNYTLMNMPLGSSLGQNLQPITNSINEEKKTNKEMINLNNEYKKRNAILINLNNQIMPTLNNIINSFDKIKNIDNKEKINKEENETNKTDNKEENETYKTDNKEENETNKTDNKEENETNKTDNKEEKNIYLYDSDEDIKKNN